MISLFGWICFVTAQVLERAWRLLLRRDLRDAAVMPPLPEPHPVVTIQLPVCDELYVVARLIDGCCAIDYPRDRLQIQVLDDSRDETTVVIASKVDEYRRRGFDISHVRRPSREGFKAGNLQHGLATARGEFIAVFDADFVVDRDFLHETLPHFRDDDVGIVYPRNVRPRNRDLSLLTLAQAPFGESSAPRGRYLSGRFFNFFFGSPGVIRRTCLDSVGGWLGDTLCEDEDLSIRAYLGGWRCVVVLSALATADVPERMEDVKNQYVRWKQGNAECYRKYLFTVLTSRAIGPWQRLAIVGAMHAPWVYVPTVALITLASVPALLADDGSRLARTMLTLPSAVALLWLIGAFVQKRACVLNQFLQLGLYPRVTLGVLKGLLRVPTPFVRSAKFDSKSTAPIAEPDRYRGRVTPATFVEGLLAMYCGLGLYAAWLRGSYWLVPFHVIGLLSFSFVFAWSLSDVLGPGSLLSRTPKDATRSQPAVRT